MSSVILLAIIILCNVGLALQQTDWKFMIVYAGVVILNLGLLLDAYEKGM